MDKDYRFILHVSLLCVVIVLVVSGVNFIHSKIKFYQTKQIEQEEKIQKLLNKQNQSKNEIKGNDNTDGGIITNDSSAHIITANDIAPYLGGIVEILCSGNDASEGSGSLWYFDEIGYTVLTNKHVISTDNCDMFPNGILGVYNLDREYLLWNSNTDVAVLKITTDATTEQISPDKSKLNYSIGKLRNCPEKMSLNSPIVLVGYPASTASQTSSGSLSPQTITNGIISAYDTSARIKSAGDLKYENYFVSAKIDSGNSGGIAFSKDKNGMCLLGIPTWVSLGNYDTQGVIQNIWNILQTH